MRRASISSMRCERTRVWIAGRTANYSALALWVLAVLTNVTVFQ